MFRKSCIANIHFFLLFAKKVVILHPLSPRETVRNRNKIINPRKGARVVEEARLESE